MKLPAEIVMLIRDIHAFQAYQIIKDLGNPSVTVFSGGQLHNVKDVVQEDCVKQLKAIDIGPFIFWGGPPDKLAWYEGTLFTLLCDRILDIIEKHGFAAAREVICLPPIDKQRVWL